MSNDSRDVRMAYSGRRAFGPGAQIASTLVPTGSSSLSTPFSKPAPIPCALADNTVALAAGLT